jgi:antitoxin ParD1/3/4
LLLLSALQAQFERNQRFDELFRRGGAKLALTCYMAGKERSMPSSFTIGDHFERMIEQLVETGRYADANEVVRDGLRLLLDRERKLATLDAAVERGLADVDAGRVHDIEEVRSRLQQVASPASTRKA